MVALEASCWSSFCLMTACSSWTFSRVFSTEVIRESETGTGSKTMMTRVYSIVFESFCLHFSFVSFSVHAFYHAFLFILVFVFVILVFLILKFVCAFLLSFVKVLFLVLS